MTFIWDVFVLYAERKVFFANLLMEHVVLTFTAILIISLIGLFVGIYMTRNRRIAEIVMGFVNFLYTIPSIAFFGFLVSITGIGNKSALIALVIYGLMPMIRNTYAGIMGVDEDVVESALGMGSTDWQLLWKVQLPIALPVIIAGFRTMVVMTIALGGIASFIGAGGLGVAIWRGITTNFTEMTFAGSLLVALLAIVSDWLLGKVEKKVRMKIFGTEKRRVA
jgi:osmoprotectant transport system permease protein